MDEIMLKSLFIHAGEPEIIRKRINKKRIHSKAPTETLRLRTEIPS